MRFAITGLNHKTAPVEVREKLALPEASLPGELERLRQLPGFNEALILSTCNRVEFAAAVDDSADPRESVVELLARRHGLTRAGVEPHLYTHVGQDAVRHLFRVASSLDSMVVGEPQILGQLKAAYAAAKDTGASGRLLDLIVTRAFAVAKRVRTETDIGQSAVSVSYAAVELAREIFGDLRGKRVLLIGAGKMSALTAKHLRRTGASDIYVTNRTHQRAVDMAAQFDGLVVDYQSFPRLLPTVDILITSSGAPHFVITHDMMRQVIQARRNKPVFLIDIAVPRNVEPDVHKIDNVYVFNVDDLEHQVAEGLKARHAEVEAAEKIVAHELTEFEKWAHGLNVQPTVVSLRAKTRAVLMAELERTLGGRLKHLPEGDRAALTQMIESSVNKLMHAPTTRLKASAASEAGPELVEAVRHLFDLPEPPSEDDDAPPELSVADDDRVRH